MMVPAVESLQLFLELQVFLVVMLSNSLVSSGDAYLLGSDLIDRPTFMIVKYSVI